jgi:hypothetical protein
LSFILTEKQRLKVFKKRVLRKIFGPKMTKLYDEELHLKVKYRHMNKQR